MILALACLAPASRASVRCGLTGSANLTTFTPLLLSDEGLGSHDAWSWAGAGGLQLEVPLRPHFVLASGLEYGDIADRVGFTVVFTDPYSSATIKFDFYRRLHTLSMPVRLEWRAGNWRLGAGPEVLYLLRADARWSEPVIYTAPSSATAAGRRTGPAAQIFEGSSVTDWNDITSNYRRWSLAMQVAAAREVPLGRHTVRIDGRWSEGLTDWAWAPAATQRVRAARFGLGLLW